MKTQTIITSLALAIISTLNARLSTARAQGSLTPPGPPAPTMKTLDQIEARTPISSAPFTITQAGSYYLTTNLTVTMGDAVDINTSGVTLDLNGFTISSTAASPTGTGILLKGGGLRGITIVNGHILGGITNNGSGVYSGSGFANGITYSVYGYAPVKVLVSHVSVSGCLYDGVDLNIGESTVVESCTVRSYGISASTVRQSSAIDCGNTAIYGLQVSDCQGQSSGFGTGVYAFRTVQNCSGSSLGVSYGINAGVAQNCSGDASSAAGILTTIAQNCYGYSGGNGDGIDATIAQNCYGDSSGGDGLRADEIAIGCYGSSSSGTGVAAFIANSCVGTSLDVTHNVNSFVH